MVTALSPLLSSPLPLLFSSRLLSILSPLPSSPLHSPPLLSPPLADFLVERDNDYCTCETPCNMTRFGKELSFVKIPSKASAKYLAKKFNKTEDYIA